MRYIITHIDTDDARKTNTLFHSAIFSKEKFLTDDVLASSHESNKERKLPRSLINPQYIHPTHTHANYL